MSNLRHVVKTRKYRERAQPAARDAMGLLEKKQDYKLRANDFHRKENALRSMRKKAAAKNPDEFYTAMVHTKLHDGVHTKRSQPNRSADELAAFNKEDAGYVAMKLAIETSKLERLRSNLHGLDALDAPQNQRVVFVDSREAAVAAAADDEAREAGGREGGGAGVGATRKAEAASKKHVAAQYSELEQRAKRKRNLSRTLVRLNVERALQGKGKRKKLKSSGAGGDKCFKWRQERKR